ncbi:MAG TPA: CRISPR-associated protein Cas5 [Gammaproteobacteria bacterium]|nr:CRISPR-associated protein Cas5 [Gammaproteobacteria bacterium]
MKNYEVFFEIEGPHAMFSRPDTGSSFISYPAPTFSAAKGMFESIARLKSAYIRPTKVEICKPIQYAKYATNYGGPLRKANQLAKKASYQLMAMILINVCYRIYGKILLCGKEPDGINSRHALQEIFFRRLSKGQYWHTPCLGWKEFVPSYIGPFRQETKVETTINEVIPSMLVSPFDTDVNGDTSARYIQNVKIVNGVLRYDQ